jgi:K+-sensing histidine kinase KdpD
MEPPSFVSTQRGKVAVAIGLTLIAIVLQWLMFSLIGKRAPFLMFLPAIMLTAMLCGPWMSLLVMIVGGVNGALLLSQHTEIMQPASTTALVLLIYLAAGLTVSALGSRLHASILRTREAEDRLEVALLDTGVALFDIDLRAETIFASGSLRKLLGHPAMEHDSNRLMTLAEWGTGIAVRKPRPAPA